jgi:hypothetical protein
MMVGAQDRLCGAYYDLCDKAATITGATTVQLSHNGTTMLVQEYIVRILDRAVYECQVDSYVETIVKEWVERPALLNDSQSSTTLAALSGDGTRVVANIIQDDDDGQSQEVVALWEYSHLTKSWTTLGKTTTGPSTALAVSADGNVTAIRNGNGAVSVHAYQNETTLSRLGGNDDSILSVTLEADVDHDAADDGLALSEDGTILAVGDSTRDQVNVYQYHGQNDTWTRLGQTITGGTQFGHAVTLSLSGTLLAVGAATASTRGTLVIGQVSVFAWDNGVWVRSGPNSNGGAVGENFGSTVALSGDGTVLVVSSSGNGMHTGSVGTYFWDDATEMWRRDPCFGDSHFINDAIAGATVSANGLVIAIAAATTVEVSRLNYCDAPPRPNASTLPLCSDYASASSGASISPTMAPHRENEPDVSTNSNQSNGTTQTTTSPRVESDSLDRPMLGAWLAIVAAAILAIATIGWKCRFHASKRWERRAVEPKSDVAAPWAAESSRGNVDTHDDHEEAFSERMPLEPLAPLSVVRIEGDDSLSVNHSDHYPLDVPTMSDRALEPPGHQLFTEECPYKDQFGDDDYATGVVVCAPSIQGSIR